MLLAKWWFYTIVLTVRSSTASYSFPEAGYQ